MADPRIIDIELDQRTIIWRNADVEQERRIAIFDLLEENHFAPQREHPDKYAGPYKVRLGVEEGRLVIEIRREDDSPLETIILGLARFRRAIKDYFAIFRQSVLPRRSRLKPSTWPAGASTTRLRIS